MNLLYQVECSSTHSRRSDIDIFSFEGHEYVEMLRMPKYTLLRRKLLIFLDLEVRSMLKLLGMLAQIIPLS